MGSTRRRKYRIECVTDDKNCSKMVIGLDKKPKSLRDWCFSYEKSEFPGQPNAHIGQARGYPITIISAKLISQNNEETVEEYNAPAINIRRISFALETLCDLMPNRKED